MEAGLAHLWMRVYYISTCSIIEAMGLPVRITPGSYTNIKVTTPDDMSVAEGFLEQNDGGASRVAAAATA